MQRSWNETWREFSVSWGIWRDTNDYQGQLLRLSFNWAAQLLHQSRIFEDLHSCSVRWKHLPIIKVFGDSAAFFNLFIGRFVASNYLLFPIISFLLILLLGVPVQIDSSPLCAGSKDNHQHPWRLLQTSKFCFMAPSYDLHPLSRSQITSSSTSFFRLDILGSWRASRYRVWDPRIGWRRTHWLFKVWTTL